MAVLRVGWQIVRAQGSNYRLLYCKAALLTVTLFLPVFVIGVLKAPAPVSSERFVERFSSLETSEKVPPSIAWFPRWLEDEEWGKVSPVNLLAQVVLGSCVLGAVVFTFQWARDQMALNGLLREARPADARVKRIVVELGQGLALRDPVELLVISRQVSPFACGWFRKKIVIDETAARSWEENELRMALAHELAHVHSNDVIWQQLAGLLSSILWFHPLAWGVRNQYMRLTERVSDEVAMFVSEEESAYARLLAKAALGYSCHQKLNTVSSFRGTCSVRQRIAALSVPAKNPLAVSKGIRLGLFFSSVALVAGLASSPALLEATGEGGERFVFEEVLRDLSSDQWRTREHAALSLAKLEHFESEALAPLMACLADDEWAIRKAAAMAIAKIGPEGRIAAGELTRLLGDSEWQVRQASAFALASVGASLEEVPALVGALEDDEWHVRKPAAIALGRIGAEAVSALPNLVAATEDPEWFVRKAAIEAVCLVGSESSEVRSVLLSSLYDVEGPVRLVAAKYLLRMEGEPLHSQSEAIERITSEDPVEIAIGRDAILENASR
ncbi:HEAT repeat domain-containing protein [Pelagicoccus mobilis]|uniref:HEAT repeat domain-containing protein n=1 Tax=Pelagicoccus mobilis TaxID=415221 RepID=A0A934S035_9BACT|nr:HEAT repeat domain-containing protein [Pelagicoccus mobilis]MBK1878715.1 HEAT repeat domain-containing protein [Pelagicoccus mobilis]